MNSLALPGFDPSAGGGAQKPRRGRPPGSKNKRSQDLGRYIEAHYGGLTPGQQAAQIGMVTARELAAAKPAAKALGLDPLVYAMAKKARALALELGCDAALAWELMRKERAEVMPYIHQKRPQAAEDPGKVNPSVPIIALADMDAAGDQVLDLSTGEYEEIQGLEHLAPVEVSQPKSHDDPEALGPQGLEAATPPD